MEVESTGNQRDGNQREGSQREGSQPLNVTQITQRIKDILEGSFPDVWVAGEIADYTQSHAGHIYFSLKDSKSTIRAVIWASTAARLRFRLQDGLQVICRGEVNVYPPRGTYQLVIRSLQPQGEGALQLALRQLHRRLAAEGLFDAARKRPLPRFPRRIAVVTSPTGAAIRDFLEVARRRWPALEVLVIPARVQGEGAAEEIALGIEIANQLVDVPDVVLVTRGGGSLDELWSFNEEIVVRSIHASRIPVVSAVGHEIDVTLSDLVADVRALTPTEAAELIAPSRDELLAATRQLQRRLVGGLRRRADEARARLTGLEQRRCLRRPTDRLQELMRRVDEWDLRATMAVRRATRRAGERLQALQGQLEALSPLSILARGYSVTLRAETGELIREASQVSAGERLVTRLAAGTITSRVEEPDEK